MPSLSSLAAGRRPEGRLRRGGTHQVPPTAGGICVKLGAMSAELPVVDPLSLGLRSAPAKTLAALCGSPGPLSRAQLKRLLGASSTTVSDALAVLAEEGLVIEAGYAGPTGGRRAVLSDLSGEVGGVLAADVGGSDLRVCAANLRGQCLACREVPTPRDPTALRVAFSRALREMCDGLPGKVLAVCIAVAGIVHPRTSTISMTSNVPGWTVQSMPKWLGELDAPLIIENEANAGAFGEARFGAAVGIRDVLFVSIGAGIGSGLIQDGRLVRGTTGAAGEIGLMVGGWSGKVYLSRLEDLASGTALLRNYKKHGGLADCNPADLFTFATSGDMAAKRSINTALDALAASLTNSTLMIDPEMIVLGGGLAAGAGELLSEALQQRLKKLLPTERPPRVVTSTLGAHGALRGAASLAARAAVSELVEAVDTKVTGRRRA